MKKVLLTMVLGMVALAGFSQVRWDARIGMSMANMTKLESDMKMGYTLGVGMDYQFTDMWSLQSGLMFTGKGYKLSYPGDTDDLKTTAHYLEIPVLAAVKFGITDNMKLVVNAGPYLAFGLGGKCKYGKEDWKYFSDEKDEDGEVWSEGAKRFDLGLQYGVGLEINDHFLVNLTGQYGFISPFDAVEYDEDDHVSKISPKNLSFLISVGYRF